MYLYLSVYLESKREEGGGAEGGEEEGPGERRRERSVDRLFESPLSNKQG